MHFHVERAVVEFNMTCIYFFKLFIVKKIIIKKKMKWQEDLIS